MSGIPVGTKVIRGAWNEENKCLISLTIFSNRNRFEASGVHVFYDCILI